MTHAPWLQPLSPEEPEHEWERDDLDQPTYLRRPRRLTLVESGELEEGEESPGVSAVHWAPLPTTWTAEPPTHPGVYQCRPPGATGYAFVLVYEDAAGALCWKPYPLRMTNSGLVPAAPRHDQLAELEWSNRAIPTPLEPRA